LNDLPGLAIRAPVARFAPAVEASDRTMQVEIDLFNGPDAAYRKFVANTVGAVLAPLAGAGPLDGLGAEAAGFFVAHRDQKGLRDRLPPRPVTADGQPLTRRLLPGMTGYVRLELDQFTDVPLLPSSAIFSKGGQTYILVVRGGVTR